MGTKVYIGDKLCGEITQKTMTDGYQGTNDSTTYRNYGNGYQVICNEPVTGGSVRIESDNPSKDTDQYTAGMAVCDVKVYSNKREPVF